MPLSQLEKIRRIKSGTIKKIPTETEMLRFKAMVYRVGRTAKSKRQFDGTYHVQILGEAVSQ